MPKLTPDQILEYNRNAWTRQSVNGNRWTVPYGVEVIERARKGILELVLTPSKAVPMHWYPPNESAVLCLASGGGQQVPALAAAGYKVTSFDLSEAQLKADESVARQFNLEIKLVQGDMADLSAFENESFDFVFNPCSTTFVPDVRKVYKEVGRVLKPGGTFVTGFTNPVYYLFDLLLQEKGIFTLKYAQPYSDLESLNEEERTFLNSTDEPLAFGHSLEDHLNGHKEAGLTFMEMFEDSWGGTNAVDKYFPAFIAFRSVKVS
ncbi:MAG TPA: class I SAM-dependent methyltransferase [Bacteroidia bacterium]|nr:class I SAM-dependent methyltransferase [Bacteroidia bacterium]